MRTGSPPSSQDRVAPELPEPGHPRTPLAPGSGPGRPRGALTDRRPRAHLPPLSPLPSSLPPPSLSLPFPPCGRPKFFGVGLIWSAVGLDPGRIGSSGRPSVPLASGRRRLPSTPGPGRPRGPGVGSPHGGGGPPGRGDRPAVASHACRSPPDAAAESPGRHPIADRPSSAGRGWQRGRAHRPDARSTAAGAREGRRRGREGARRGRGPPLLPKASGPRRCISGHVAGRALRFGPPSRRRAPAARWGSSGGGDGRGAVDRGGGRVDGPGGGRGRPRRRGRVPTAMAVRWRATGVTGPGDDGEGSPHDFARTYGQVCEVRRRVCRPTVGGRLRGAFWRRTAAHSILVQTTSEDI